MLLRLSLSLLLDNRSLDLFDLGLDLQGGWREWWWGCADWLLYVVVAAAVVVVVETVAQLPAGQPLPGPAGRRLGPARWAEGWLL